MAAVLNPVRNISTHFAQEQVESRNSPIVSSSSSSSPSPGLGKLAAHPKTLKHIFRSSLQETIRNVTLVKKSRDSVPNHELSHDSSYRKDGIEQTHSQRPPPSAFTSHFHRPSIFRRSPGPENPNNSNGSIDIPSGTSSGTSTPVHRRSADLIVNSHSLTIQANDSSTSPPPPSTANEPPRPRVLRKQSNRVKTRASDSHHPSKTNSAAPSSKEGIQRLSAPSTGMLRHEHRSDAESIGWSAFVAPSLSKGSMSSPTLLQHVAENAKEEEEEEDSGGLASSSKTRSPLLSLGGLFPPARTRKISIVEPPAPTLHGASQKNSEKAPIAEKGGVRKRVSSSALPSRLLSGTVKALGVANHSSSADTKSSSTSTPTSASASASTSTSAPAPPSSSSQLKRASSPPAAPVSPRSKVSTTSNGGMESAVSAPPAVPPKSPSRLLRPSVNASTSHLENIDKQDDAQSPMRETKKKTEKGDGKESSKSKISSRIIGMGHPSTMRKAPSASTSDLPSTAKLYTEDLTSKTGDGNGNGPSVSSSAIQRVDLSPPRRFSEDAPTIRASASSPSMSRRGSTSQTTDTAAVSGRLSPKVRPITSTAASRARAVSPSNSGGRGSFEATRNSNGHGHLIPRGSSPVAIASPSTTGVGIKQRRSSSSSAIRPELSPSPTPTTTRSPRQGLGRGIGSISTSHLPLEANRNVSPLPSSASPNASPSPSPISNPARAAGSGNEVGSRSPLPPLQQRSSSINRPSHSSSSSSAAAILTSLRKDGGESESKPQQQRTSKMQLRTELSAAAASKNRNGMSPPQSPLRSRSMTSTPLLNRASPVPDSPLPSSSSPIPDSPSPSSAVDDSAVNNASSLSAYVPSPQRTIIRRAASVLVKEVVHRKHPAAALAGSCSTPAKSEWDGDEIDSRMRSLVRLEKTWSLTVIAAGGEDKERRVFSDALRDGYVLCQYINKVCPGSVIRIDATLAGKQLNVTKFLAAVAAFGVSSDDIFDMEDLTAYPATSDGLARVALTILAVKKLQDDPPPLKFQYKIDTKQHSSSSPSNTSLNGASPTISPITPKSAASAQSKSHANVYLSSSSNVGLASASTPNLSRSISPTSTPVPVAIKRSRPVGSITPVPSPQIPAEVSSPTLCHDVEEEDVFGPVDANVHARPLVKMSTTSRTSMASTYTDTSVYSSLLDNRSTRFETIKSIATEATSLASDTPSLTHTEGSAVKVALTSAAALALAAKESPPPPPQQKIRRLSTPSSPVDEFPSRRKDRRRSDSIDLSRVAEESEEGTIPTRRLRGLENGSGTPPAGPSQPQRVIKLGQAKWPDDFIKAFDMDREKEGGSPVKKKKQQNQRELGDRGHRDSAEIERGKRGGGEGRCTPGGAVNLDDSLAKRKPSLAIARPSLDSTTETITTPTSSPPSSPPTPTPAPRVRLRNSQHRVVTTAAAELGSRVSPRSSFEHSPVRRPSFQSSSARTSLDGELSPAVPFPTRAPSFSQLSTLPSSTETLVLPPLPSPPKRLLRESSSPTKMRVDVEPLKDRRSSFGDSPNPRIPMRPRHESLNVTPGESSKAERGLIGGLDGSQVRKTLIVKEDGKPATHYQLGNCIGRGQFGTVYRALNLNTGQTVAVKRIRLEGLSEKEIKQLMHEVEIVKQLSHPSIVKYEGMARDPDTLSIVLEYAENGSLSQTLKAYGKLSESLVAGFVTKVLEGLHYLHTSQVVHCDLKAANILTTKTGNVKLSDFGVSLNLRAMEQMNNDVAGTPNWMAPEVIELKGASPASDIWSLACTIVELLTARPPYADVQNGMTVMFRIVEDPMPPLPEDLSDDLRDFLTLCFNKDPTKRPNAETLFEHPWLKNEWGMYKELRPQDSIPFLRRVSADLQRTDVRRLSFVDDDRPNSPRSIPPSSPTFCPIETVFRPHEFVKSNFSQAVTCRICNQAVKKSVLCKECGLIAHARCAADAADSCEPRGRVIRLSQDVARQHTPTADLHHQSSSPTQSPKPNVSFSSPGLPAGDVPSSPSTPTANDRFRLFGRKRSKASGIATVSTEDLKAGLSSSPPVAFMNGVATKPTQRIPRSPSQDNGQWQASIGGSDHSTGSRSVMTRSSRLSGSNRGSEYDPIPEVAQGASNDNDCAAEKPVQPRSSRKGRQEGNSNDKCLLQ